MMDALAFWLGERLLLGSIQVVGLVAIVWLICRFVRQVPAAVQATLWWLVALKLVLVLLPVPAIPIPLLPPQIERPSELLQATSSATHLEGQANPFSVPARALILLWFVVLLAQTARLVVAHRHLRGVVRRSIPWTDSETGVLATQLGLRTVPQVRLSDEINSPQVFGLWSPVVLIPTGAMTTLSDEERAMTLCHELMHVRRRDLVFGWVPACAERLFFFHPLARVAAREYLTAREAACDADAVRALGVRADDYGRMLIRLGIANVRPAVAAGGSPFSTSSLKRRLHMLDHQPSKSSPRWLWVVVLIGVAMLPLQIVARTPDAQQQERGKKATIASNSSEDGEMFLAKADGVELKKLVFADDQKEIKRQLEKDKFFTDQNDVEWQLKVEKAKKLLDEARLAQRLDQKLKVAKVFAKAEQAFNEQTLREKFEKVIASQAEAKAAQNESKLAYRAAIQKAIGDQIGGQEASRNQEEALARGLQRLAERLERLAAEQQQLAEELKQLQRAPR